MCGRGRERERERERLRDSPSLPPQGGQLIRVPSMTLSESQAMDTFEFLGSEDNILAHRFSRTSIDIAEGEGSIMVHLVKYVMVLVISSVIWPLVKDM